jgi:prevent-host-death family protein
MRQPPKPRLWPLQDAKNGFSRLVEEAQAAPQVVTRRGKEAAVVVSYESYRRLVAPACPLLDLLLTAPKVPGGLVVKRGRDAGRRVDLG